MMELIREMVRNIVIWLLLASVAELLLPSGALSRPARLVLGLLLICGVAVPLSQFNADEALPPPDWPASVVPAEADAYVEQGSALAAQLREQATDGYQAQAEQQIAALAALCDGVEDAAAQVELGEDGQIVRVELTLQLSANAPPAETAREAGELVRGFYLLAAEQIICQVAEVREHD